MAAIERIIVESTSMEPDKATEETNIVTKITKLKSCGEGTSFEGNPRQRFFQRRKTFDLRYLGGGELSAEELFKLQEFAIAGGYRPSVVLFGGVDEDALECLPDRAGARVVNTLTKSIGFLKLENELSNYKKKHITGSLAYSNFKV